MQFNKVTIDAVDFFKSVLGEAYVMADDESLHHYGHDETRI